MLLVIDVGNTNMVLGVYAGSQLLKDWRVHNEFNVLINSLFSVNNIQPHDVDRTFISCVVPPMVTILDAFCQKYLGHAPQWVDAQNCAGMPIRIKNPAEVGADRIVNAVAAFHKYNTSLIVVDFGMRFQKRENILAVLSARGSGLLLRHYSERHPSYLGSKFLFHRHTLSVKIPSVV
jgi:type III pantothenate kinase